MAIRSVHFKTHAQCYSCPVKTTTEATALPVLRFGQVTTPAARTKSLRRADQDLAEVGDQHVTKDASRAKG